MAIALAARRCTLAGIHGQTSPVGSDGALRLTPDVQRALRRIDGWMDETGAGVPAVLPGSPLAGDDRKLEGLPVSHAAWSAFVYSVDHLHALKSLLLDARVIHNSAPFSLLRASLENAASAIWLLEPRARTERLRRRLMLAHLDAWESGKVQSLTGQTPKPPGRPADVRIREIKERAIKLGLQDADVARPNYRAIVVRASAAVHLGGDLGELLWRLCSGFTHGRSWASISFLERVDEERHGNVVNVKFEPPVEALLRVMQTGVAMTLAARRLYEIRRQPYG